jgi:hypothetical protein
MAENTAQQPAMTEAQVLQQYAAAAGLDINKPEHAGIVAQTLQVAAAQGMSAENPTQVKAILATMQELARLEDKPEDLRELATSLGLDVAAIEQQRQTAITNLEQMEATIKQNQKRMEELQSKARSRSVANLALGILGAAGGWFAANKYLNNSYKDKMVGTGDDAKFPEDGLWKRRGIRLGSGVVGGGLLQWIGGLMLVKPIEKEFQALDAQNMATDAKMQETVTTVQGQSAGIAEELTKRLLTVAVQQLEQQEQQAKTAAADKAQPPAHHHAKKPEAHAHTGEGTEANEAQQQHQAGHGTHPDVIAERKETQHEVPLHTAPQHQSAVEGADTMTVKKETGAPEAQGFTQKVPQPANNYVAAAEVKKQAAMQPMELGA